MCRLLHSISGYLPARIISGEMGEPYLECHFIARL